jgi:peptidoglycan/xylan/chitin deacetylase (PgdA/CDA1 family)
LKHYYNIVFTAILLVIAYTVLGNTIWFILASIGILLLFVLILIYGVYQIQWNYFVKAINRGKPIGISLTFDDGPDETYTIQIATMLHQHQISATFFVIGNKAEQHPELLKQLVELGHHIGNHSYSHAYVLPSYSTKKLTADLAHCAHIIHQTIGKKPLLFRPPFGVTTPRYHRAVNKLNLQTIGWSLRSYDTTIKAADDLFHHITPKIKHGDIVLLHDTQEVTLHMLPKLINYCKSNGIKIVSLQELTTVKTYEDAH